jgi:hypothetical protein
MLRAGPSGSEAADALFAQWRTHMESPVSPTTAAAIPTAIHVVALELRPPLADVVVVDLVFVPVPGAPPPDHDSEDS